MVIRPPGTICRLQDVIGPSICFRIPALKLPKSTTLKFNIRTLASPESCFNRIFAVLNLKEVISCPEPLIGVKGQEGKPLGTEEIPAVQEDRLESGREALEI
jgi:hypothetical protein